MAAMRAACCVTLVLLVLDFPAAAIARFGPGADPSVQTSSPLVHGGQILHEQTPQVNSVYGVNDHRQRSSTSGLRRGLVGSSPPTCLGRCEACVPCKPVHVAITSPHTVISGADYYPEVWQCLCGNKYYMP